jgi:hypothetical protein
VLAEWGPGQANQYQIKSFFESQEGGSHNVWDLLDDERESLDDSKKLHLASNYWNYMHGRDKGKGKGHKNRGGGKGKGKPAGKNARGRGPQPRDDEVSLGGQSERDKVDQATCTVTTSRPL